MIHKIFENEHCGAYVHITENKVECCITWSCGKDDNPNTEAKFKGQKGYEGPGVRDSTMPRYNGSCLGDDGSHPPFPFELWLNSGHTIRDEEGLKKALAKNHIEWEERIKARV